MHKNKLIYLASPYSHAESWVKEMRERLVTAVAARLTHEGHCVFSPITESHQCAMMHNLPGGWEFWENKDRLIISKCDELWILRLRGWKESVGVQAEIKLAKEIGIHIRYLVPEEYLPEYNDIFKGCNDE